MSKVAWLGTGMMGAGFVEALRRRGEDVTVWNRTFEKARALEKFGAVAVEDPREAVRDARIVHAMLVDDATVDDMLTRLEGAIPEGAVFVDHTTVAPEPTAARFARCAARGIAFAHAPVFMSPQACRDAQGVMLCAAAQDVFAKIEGDLRPMTGELWYVGDAPKKAATLKLAGNEMILFLVAGLADAFATARAADVSSSEAFELFSHFKVGNVLEYRGKNMAKADFTSAFDLTMARKDARLMIETAASGGQTLHVLPTIAARMDELIAAGHGSEDVGVLAIDAALAPA